MVRPRPLHPLSRPPVPPTPDEVLAALGAAACRVGGNGALAWIRPGPAGPFANEAEPLWLAELDARAGGAATRAMETGHAVQGGGRDPLEFWHDPARDLLIVRRPAEARDLAGRLDLQAQALAEALRDRRICLFVQPIVDADDARVVRMEGLARLVRPDGTIAPPSEFIPAAERGAMIGELDLVTLDLALADLARRKGRRLAVNVSAATLEDQASREAYLDRLERHGGVGGRLTVEITETIAIRDLDVAAAFAERVRAPGIRLALDDFGEGHTSFRSMMRIPLDEVKIDGLYVQDVDTREDAQAFVRAIQKLSGDLGLETVAERVETAAEAAALRGIGVKGLQGFLFGRPRASAAGDAF